MEPYADEFKASEETPNIWWLAIDDTNNHLQTLALYIFSVTPHSASCERIFSTLGWLYGKHRLRLHVSKVEAMAKIRSYYTSKVNEELQYESSKFSKNELKEMINDSLDQFEEDFEDTEDEEEFYDAEDQLSTSDHNNTALIENIFDLRTVPFLQDSDDEILLSKDEEEESDKQLEQDNNNNDNFDYDVEQLAENYLD
jgi:hypothetical protein